MNRILNEGFDFHDLLGQVIPEVTVDEYAAKMGTDDEIVTVAFTVKGKQPASDLVDWLERGYDFVLDAEVSEGELTPGKYLVFVEMDRRTMVPDRIIELIDDMETLTDLKLSEWTVKIDGEDYDADPEIIKQKLILSPIRYRELKETELNEMRQRAGMETHKLYGKPDSLLRDFIAKAGL